MSSVTEKKTVEARRKILQLIWDESLVQGDRLPSCAELCARFGLGASTVFAALKSLCDEGVLRSRNKVGFFADDLWTPGLFGYHVALVINGPDIPPISFALTHLIQRECLNRGCSVTVFSGSFRGPNTSHEDVFEVIPGLKRLFGKRAFDGVITLVSLSGSNIRTFEEAGIPVCFAGGFCERTAGGEAQPSPFRYRASILAEPFFRLGGKRMRELGAKRPALLWPRTMTEYASMRFFREECSGRILAGTDWKGADSLADDLLRIPKKERPDALLIPDDLVAQRLYANLALRTGSLDLPRPVVLTEAEIPFFLPVAADRLEIRLKDLASKAVSVLKSAMKNHDPEERMTSYTAPELVIPERKDRC